MNDTNEVTIDMLCGKTRLLLRIIPVVVNSTPTTPTTPTTPINPLDQKNKKTQEPS